jgi:hypothetical protein
VGSCNIQPVKVAVGVQGGWIEATICDRVAPASPIARLASLCVWVWLIGQLVDE